MPIGVVADTIHAAEMELVEEEGRDVYQARKAGAAGV